MSKAAVFCCVLGVWTTWALWAFADAGQSTRESEAWQLRSITRRDSSRMRITGGWFQLGSDAAELESARALCVPNQTPACDASLFAAEAPAHRVYVRAFAIDRLEVSNAAYQRCVDRGRCYPTRSPAGALPPSPDLPVTWLNFAEAREYCRFMGGDLPTEAQWEYAAHGTSKRSFPWGQTWNSQLANFANTGATPQAVTAYPDGKSFFGLLNMAGNVWEFVLDRYQAPYDTSLPNVDPLVDAGSEPSSEHVLRGGSFRSPPYMLRARYRAAIRADEAREDVGLRCAYPTATSAAGASMLGSPAGRTYAARPVMHGSFTEESLE